MQKQDIRFIHIRRNKITVETGHQFNRICGTIDPNGGMTFAWRLNDDGHIVVGAPAVCANGDAYVRNTGSVIAAQNLELTSPIMVLAKPVLVEIAVESLAATLGNIGDVTQSGTVELLQHYREQLLTDLRGSLTSRFFEEVIRVELRKVYNSKVNKYGI